MKTIPEKRGELWQTLASMLPAIRSQQGCRRCESCRNENDKNEVCMIGEWDSRESAMAHLDSEILKVLLGATALLAKPHEVGLYAPSDFPERSGMEPLKAEQNRSRHSPKQAGRNAPSEEFWPCEKGGGEGEG